MIGRQSMGEPIRFCLSGKVTGVFDVF